MKNLSDPVPVVLALSAHDPSGAAGVQADIESIYRNRGHCVSVITALTAQNTETFTTILPQDPVNFRQQAQLLLTDITVDACKIGLIGNPLLVPVITGILDALPPLPLVIDPVLHTGTGVDLADEAMTNALLEYLLPHTTVLTPNLKEALRLTGKHSKDDAAGFLLDKGCQSILITGTDESTPMVINSLYTPNHAAIHYEWERLPGTYHGSGCTLASAIAAQLANKVNIEQAVTIAQNYTWQTLKYGYMLGKGQYHPDRNYTKNRS